jgi:hypothetical protein
VYSTNDAKINAKSVCYSGNSLASVTRFLLLSDPCASLALLYAWRVGPSCRRQLFRFLGAAPYFLVWNGVLTSAASFPTARILILRQRMAPYIAHSLFSWHPQKMPSISLSTTTTTHKDILALLHVAGTCSLFSFWTLLPYKCRRRGEIENLSIEPTCVLFCSTTYFLANEQYFSLTAFQHNISISQCILCVH